MSKREVGLIVKGSDILTRVEKSIEIKAQPEKVWEMLAFDRLLEWEEGYKRDFKSVEYTSEVRTHKDKYRVGASAHGTPKKQEKCDLEITESLENEKITYRLYNRGNVLVTYILEPIEEGTKFAYVVEYEMPWSILGKLLEILFFRRQLEKVWERSLENLKSILGEIV